MAFIFLKTDAFQNVSSTAHENDIGTQGAGPDKRPVRRPYRGIQIKDDTYSTLAVRHPDGSPVFLTSSSARDSKGIGKVEEYSDYILQSVQEQRMEKQQIIETFGEPYFYFFGERPRIIQISGQLINTEDFNWRSQFWLNYDEHIRGTKLVQQNARAYLSFDTIVVEGYVLNASAIDTADNPYQIPFNFSMVVTNYYDWSTIGQTEYPGDVSKLKSVEILNMEEMDKRGKFISSGVDVRYRNLTAAGGGGILATLRSGIRAVNNVMGMVGGLVSKIHDIIGGRVVRVPIGIAGYLQSTGAASIASGSIGTAEIAAALTGVYDAATGTYKNINGSVKLRMPGESTFAPAWISPGTKRALGYIYENYDEYPLLDQPETLSDISASASFDSLNRNILRNLSVEENDFTLAMYNQMAEAGSILGDIAEAVNFVKSNFGMVMSAVAFVRDPSTLLKQSLGIGVGTTSQSRIAGRSGELSKMGIKTAAQEEANKSLLEKAGQWVGGSAMSTFKNTATAKADSAEPASMGEVYNQNTYQSQASIAAAAAAAAGATGAGAAGAGDLAYEPAYGAKNYSALASQGDPTTQATLDEAYGNTDSSAGTDVNPSSLEQVYGTGSSSSAVRSPADIAAALQQAQSTNVDNDEDTSGIQGEDDANTQIDAVI